MPDPGEHGATCTGTWLSERSLCVNHWEEIEWLLTVNDTNRKTFKKGIKLLEVYADPNSRLREMVVKLGGKAERFTKEDGDLSTVEGQRKLLQLIHRIKPDHVWMAPECGPWSSWSRFNANRSIIGYQKIQRSREESIKHLKLCNVVMKMQVSESRHFHMENPVHSEIWDQKEIHDILVNTRTILFDQCRFGLRHPETQERLKKGTRLQSTSVCMELRLNNKFCHGDHSHAPIAGSCRFQSQRMNLSRFCAFYPNILAKAFAKAICDENLPPLCLLDDCEINHVNEESEHPEAPNPKRARIRDTEAEPMEGTEETREPIAVPSSSAPTSSGFPVFDLPMEKRSDNPFSKIMSILPKSGLREWNGVTNDLTKSFQDLCPEMVIHQIKAGKGLERYITGDESLPLRKTFVISRINKEQIYDLGTEEWTRSTKLHRRRKAMPSYVMICLFGIHPGASQPSAPRADEDSVQKGVEGMETELEELMPQNPEIEKNSEDPACPRVKPHGPVATWSPAAVSNPGPAFQQLDASTQSKIRKLHINLGHPTSEKLATHLSAMRAPPEMIAGAKDFLCPSCIERRPPSLHTPGKLRDAKDFNDKVEIDGFYWKNKLGIGGYVLHIIDECTHFHIGRRSQRDTHQSIRTLQDAWTSWAGNPRCMLFDAAGEFVSQEWKNFLQKENIVPIVASLSSHKGRIEKHGDIIKETLSRMDHEKPFSNLSDFDDALRLAFQAKNALTQKHGFSPEQAVLGKGASLPSSLGSDESVVSHEFAAADTPAAEQFREHLNRRTAARRAFLESDNSQAIRRAFLRKSRGSDIYPWECGQLCMFWDKRKSPNMIEKGRWCGPAQVVLHESRTIIWITHLNRLLRCSKENLRPVSLREFESHRTFIQPNDPIKMKEMAEQLNRNLKERSGMFQFSDLTGLERNPEAEEAAEDPEPVTPQPEEEPNRRMSDPGLVQAELDMQRAQTTPVPETPFDSEVGSPVSTPPYCPTTPEPTEEGPQEPIETDFAETIYNASIIEPGEDGIYLQGDSETIWDKPVETAFNACSFEFEMPKQQLMKCIKNPMIHETYLTSAAKKSHAEVKYHQLNPKEQELFNEAKNKELKCWLETSTVKRILKDRIHPSRIMTSRWVLTWKTDETSTLGHKAKARLVVRGYQDPELHQVDTDSPTLSRAARMLLLQSIFHEMENPELRHQDCFSQRSLRWPSAGNGPSTRTPKVDGPWSS